MISITTSFGVGTGCALLSSHPKNHLGGAPSQAVLGDHQVRTLEASNFSHVPAYMPAARVGGALEAFLRDGHVVGNGVGPGAVVAFAAAFAAAANRAGA